MKTPMQELLDILIEKKRNTLEAPLSDTRVALDFAIEQTRLMLEKEKEVMCEFAEEYVGSCLIDYPKIEVIFNQTFKTKE